MGRPIVVTVDDNTHLGPVFEDILEKHNVDVVHKSSRDVDDLLLTGASVYVVDVVWGTDRTAGLQLALELKQRCPHIPVLLMSKFTDDRDIQDALRHHWLKLLNKPWGNDEAAIVANAANLLPQPSAPMRNALKWAFRRARHECRNVYTALQLDFERMAEDCGWDTQKLSPFLRRASGQLDWTLNPYGLSASQTEAVELVSELKTVIRSVSAFGPGKIELVETPRSCKASIAAPAFRLVMGALLFHAVQQAAEANVKLQTGPQAITISISFAGRFLSEQQINSAVRAAKSGTVPEDDAPLEAFLAVLVATWSGWTISRQARPKEHSTALLTISR